MAHKILPQGATLSAVPFSLKGSYPDQRRVALLYKNEGFTRFRMVGTELEAYRPADRKRWLVRRGGISVLASPVTPPVGKRTFNVALSAVPPLKGSYPEQRRKAEAYRKLGFTGFRMVGTMLEASRPDSLTMLVYRNGDTISAGPVN